MAILKNRTQNNFTMISNAIFRDKDVSMKDRGVFCTISSLPDGWKFSVNGLSALVTDGKDAITTSIKNLERFGYLKKTTIKDEKGKFLTNIEIFPERVSPQKDIHSGKSVTDHPSQENRNGPPVMDQATQYNTDNKKQNNNIDQSISINLSDREEDLTGQMEKYKGLIAKNIGLDLLLGSASCKCSEEVAMVHEIYDVICDMVCVRREEVIIKGTKYPWSIVKAQFLKLNHRQVADVLNRIIDSELHIKNMHPYLVTTLYMASLVGTLEAEADIHDDYLKFLRGNPY